MKKGSLLLIVVLVFSMLAFPVSAASPGVMAYDESGLPITPARWQEISSASAALSISSAGRASSTVTVKTYTSSRKITATITLQKLSGSSYATHTSWSDSATYSLLNSNALYVEKGTYRIKVDGSIYDSSGTWLEDYSVYSPVQTYS